MARTYRDSSDRTGFSPAGAAPKYVRRFTMDGWRLACASRSGVSFCECRCKVAAVSKAICKQPWSFCSGRRMPASSV
eukprot:scaffold125951_cov39-Tisochrysis_lutea.AAC.2